MSFNFQRLGRELLRFLLRFAGEELQRRTENTTPEKKTQHTTTVPTPAEAPPTPHPQPATAHPPPTAAHQRTSPTPPTAMVAQTPAKSSGPGFPSKKTHPKEKTDPSWF
ncbi:hypothetical protein [Dermatophilus congolensis]|uniref:hypothetical protein n=1 Tax=Dermatophilus congolensis TaxID=1863 RepID=UPI00215D8DF0|nr:hypothetical protein [Dermatophilus congolensis]